MGAVRPASRCVIAAAAGFFRVLDPTFVPSGSVDKGDAPTTRTEIETAEFRNSASAQPGLLETCSGYAGGGIDVRTAY